MKSKLVILDANVIITAHRLGLWTALKTHFEIVVPSVVVQDEAHYFTDLSGEKIGIDFSEDIRNGAISEAPASAVELIALNKAVTNDFFDSIDPGEREAIALLLSGRFDQHQFCTGDTPAIKALSVFGLGHQAVSLESLLKQAGMSKNLPGHFSEQALKTHLSRGIQERDLYLRK